MSGVPQPAIVFHRVRNHCPSSQHHGRGILSFADSHNESHPSTDPRTMPPVNGSILAHWNVCPGNADLGWIQERTTYKANHSPF
jgi:hypothetical protein